MILQNVLLYIMWILHEFHTLNIKLVFFYIFPTLCSAIHKLFIHFFWQYQFFLIHFHHYITWEFQLLSFFLPYSLTLSHCTFSPWCSEHPSLESHFCYCKSHWEEISQQSLPYRWTDNYVIYQYCCFCF